MEIEKLNTNTVSDEPGMKTGKNLFKAKLLKHDKWIEGFYVQIEETVYCIAEDYESNPVPIHHMICKTQMTDWGLPNRLGLYEIDPKTLCQFTGIKKSNKKVWENDIICHKGVYAPIRYGEYQSCFDSTSTAHIGFFVDWSGSPRPMNRKDLGYWIKSSKVEIAGNIFDDSELLMKE